MACIIMLTAFPSAPGHSVLQNVVEKRQDLWSSNLFKSNTHTHIYIYIIPEGPGVLRWRSGGVGWGGVGHVTVMFMLRWCYVDGRGGVGWGMLPFMCMFRSTLASGLVPPSRAFLEAPWEKWKKTLAHCCVQAPDKTLSVHTYSL